MRHKSLVCFSFVPAAILTCCNLLASLLIKSFPFGRERLFATQAGQPELKDSKSLDLIERDFNLWSMEQRRTIFAKKKPLWWNARDKVENEFSVLKAALGRIEYVNETNENEIWNRSNKEIDLIWYRKPRMCQAAKAFKRAGSPKRHILFAGMNENWGAFSGYVPNRTKNVGSFSGSFKKTLGGCSLQTVIDYVNNNNTLAVFTTQFQHIDHPKVHSLPLGMYRTVYSMRKQLWKKQEIAFQNVSNVGDNLAHRPQLLAVTAHEKPWRKPLIETVIRNFNGTVNNTYRHTTKSSRSDTLAYSMLMRSCIPNSRWPHPALDGTVIVIGKSCILVAFLSSNTTIERMVGSERMMGYRSFG